MNKTYLLLGSNMGNTRQKLLQAKKHIEDHIGKITRESAYYQTAAWGNTNQPDFVNQAIVIESMLSPLQTIETILEIEKKMGRKRTEKNAPRIIDIDIIFFNKEVINKKKLVIPHPYLQDRRFVLVPLNEISPNFIHPVFNRTVHELLNQCPDKLDVKKI